jgi:hypothetical protein
MEQVKLDEIIYAKANDDFFQVSPAMVDGVEWL